MKTRLRSLLVSLMVLASFRASGQGTAFTYQGRLMDNGQPANGNYSLQFYLRDALVTGNPVGATNILAPVAINNGLFTVALDFGANIFDGNPRWLEIGVRTNGSGGAFTTLAPRQPITPSPYAVRSLGAASADTAKTALDLSGAAANHYIQNTQDAVITQDNSSFSISGNGSVGGNLAAYKGINGLSSTGAGVAGIGGPGVDGYSSDGYGVSGRSSTGTGVYGTTEAFFGSGYGVYGFVSNGPNSAGVYGKSTANNGSGVLGQADLGALAYGVWGKAADGRGVVGQSTNGTGVYGVSTINGVVGQANGSSGNGVVGQANGSSANGVWGINPSGSAVHGTTDTGRAVDGLASNGGAGVYGNNLGSNSKGYAGDFFGRVRVTGNLELNNGDAVLNGGALRVPGAGVGSSTSVFVHVATPSNTSGAYTTIDNLFCNGDPNAILIVTIRHADSASAVEVVYNGSRWQLHNQNGDDIRSALLGSPSYNVLVVKP